MNRKKIWDILKTPLKILVTGSLLYLVFQKIDLREVRQVYQQSNPFYFLLAIFTFFCSQVISSSRLRGFFMAAGLSLPFMYNLKLYFLGMFYNLFLPGGIGGDGYKIYLLRSTFDFPGKKLLTAVILDRLSGLWAMALIAILLTFFVPEIKFSPAILAVAFVTGSAAYILILKKFFALELATVATGHFKALVVQALQVITILFILHAFRVEGSFSPYLLTFLASSLVAIFPFTVGGLGAREYVFMLAAGLLAMDKNIAVFVSLSFYLISAIVALIGMYYVFRSKEFARPPGRGELKEKEALPN